MGQARRIRLEFPLAGLNRGLSYQRQPPFSSPDLQNVRARETFENRARGGSRPGLGKEFAQQVSGASNKIRLLSTVSFLTGTPEAYVHRVIASANGELWMENASSQLTKISLPTASYGPISLSSDKLVQAVQRGVTTYIADYSGRKTIYTDGVYQVGGDAWSGTITGVKLNGTTRMTASAGQEPFAGTDVGRNLWISGVGTFVVAAYISATQVDVTGDATCTNVSPFFVFRAYEFPGTVTGVKDNGTTTITATEEVFDSDDVGKYIRIDGVGDFAIASYTSTTVVVVTGDASAASADSYFIRTKVIFTSASVADWTAEGIDAGSYILSATVSGTTVTKHIVYSVHPEFLFLSYRNVETKQSSLDFYAQKTALSFDGTNLLRYYSSTGALPLGCPLISLYNDRLVLAGAEESPHAWYMSKQGDPTDWDYAQTDQQAAYAGAASTAGEPGEPITALIPFSNDYLIFGCTNSLYRMRGDPMVGGVLELISRKVGVLYRGAWCQDPQGKVYFLSQDGLYAMPPGAMGFPQPLSRDRLPQELENVDTSAYEVGMVYDPHQLGVHIYLTEISTGGTDWHWFYSVEAKAFMPDLYQANHEPFSVHYLASHNPTLSKVLLGCRDGYVRSYSDDNVNDDGTEIDSYVVYGPISLGSRDGYRWGMVRELVPELAQGLAAKTIDYHVVVADTPEEAVDACTDVTGTGAAGSPVYDAPNLVSTVIATTAIFTRMMVGRILTFGTSTNAFVIASFDSTTQVKVDGDASGEAGSQALTISGMFESGTWGRGKNLFARPHAGGAAFCLKLQNTTGADYSPWGVEGIIATIESKGKHRKLS